MLVNQVLDIFQDPSAEEDVSNVWLLVRDQNNRNGYLCLDLKDYPMFLELIHSSMSPEQQQARAAELLAADDTIRDFAQRPRLEDASSALQALYDEMESADSITYFDLEKNKSWENIGLSRDEYKKQIDSDIEKFNLDGIVCKNNDENVLYTCYSTFLSYFSKPGGEALAASPAKEGLNNTSSIAFIPVVFQRDKYYPFKICEIKDYKQGEPYVSYVVIYNGNDEVVFTVVGEKEKYKHAYFSALDYIANKYYNDPELAMKYFDGVEYTKKYYEIALSSNPFTRLQHSPVSLDAHWAQQFSGYTTEKIFADALKDGELSIEMMKKIGNDLNTELISQLDKQPPISEVRRLDNSIDITGTPLYAAAQYQWEQERTEKIFNATTEGMLSYLTILDEAIHTYGPTHVTLAYFSDMLHDLCYGQEGKLEEAGIFINTLLNPSQKSESLYANCHRIFTAYKNLIKYEDCTAT